jgi:protein-S-isoprenylcysteine O-methyltransferase Ste14
MSADTRSRNAANLGLFRPPLILLCSILLGVGLRFAMPRRFAPASLAAPVGIVLVLASIALFIAAVRSFRAAGTPIPGDQPTTTIVRRGPYRFSRNPIYLSFYGFQLGLAFWTNNLWQLVTLVGTVGLVALVVVPREECYLEAHFPATYLPYKASVRRWL